MPAVKHPLTRVDTGSHLTYGLYHYRGFTLLYSKPKNGWAWRGSWSVYAGIIPNRRSLAGQPVAGGPLKRDAVNYVDAQHTNANVSLR